MAAPKCYDCKNWIGNECQIAKENYYKYKNCMLDLKDHHEKRDVKGGDKKCSRLENLDLI